MKIEDYNEYYIQGSDHYLIPKDVFIELFNEMSNWRDESKQLKEVIEEVREFVGSEEMYNCSFEEETNKLLQILDKAKDSDG